jgi:hypothetical protein
MCTLSSGGAWHVLSNRTLHGRGSPGSITARAFARYDNDSASAPQDGTPDRIKVGDKDSASAP